jgi:hypothetical protein
MDPRVEAKWLEEFEEKRSWHSSILLNECTGQLETGAVRGASYGPVIPVPPEDLRVKRNS